jgi:hypothetical protein
LPQVRPSEGFGLLVAHKHLIRDDPNHLPTIKQCWDALLFRADTQRPTLGAVLTENRN